jgi:hypothetical protein
MDHNYAIENQTAERYLMGELTEVERDAYEEHFFSCSACADEIRSANTFMESARKVVQEEMKVQACSNGSRPSLWDKWLNWKTMLQPMPAAAFALFLAVVGIVGYQNSVTIPRLTQVAEAPVILQDSQQVALTVSHGEPVTVLAGKPVVLRFAVPKPDDPSVSFNSYRAEIVSNNNVVKFSLDISVQLAREPIDVSFPAGALSTGKYFLVIRGLSSSSDVQNSAKGDLGRLPFEVKNED